MEKVVEHDGTVREVVKVACPVVEGNPNGYYVTYRDAMRDGEVLFVEPQEAAAAEAEAAKGKKQK